MVNDALNKTGDEIIKQIISIIESKPIKPILGGGILFSRFLTQEFNSMYYDYITRVKAVNNIKYINQNNIPVPILNTRDARFVNAFKMKQVNGNATVNQTNNYINSILASSFMFTLSIPDNIIPENYEEEYFIKIMIVREFQKVDPNFGPRLDEILDFDVSGEELNQKNYINAMSNMNLSKNYQILAVIGIHMGLGKNNFVTTTNIKYINNPQLIFANGPIVNNAYPIIGNIYVGAIKSTIRSEIRVSSKDESKGKIEFDQIVEKLDNLDLDTLVPNITLQSRHLLQ